MKTWSLDVNVEAEATIDEPEITITNESQKVSSL